MQTATIGSASRPARRRSNARRLLIVACLAYGIFAIWRVFPRFDPRLIGAWTIPSLAGEESTITFYERGFGRQGNSRSQRTFRWWTCGGVLVKHADRRSRAANIRVAVEYAARTLLLLGPPPNVTEFEIAKLDRSSARFEERPRADAPCLNETLILSR